tara:strand:+ start:908 stop:1180 length:273 start_codon:yes stop_codon:yes gene_type:complete
LGGMGSFGLNSYSPEGISRIDKEIKNLTEKSYVLNLWVPLKNDPVDYYKKDEIDRINNTLKMVKGFTYFSYKRRIEKSRYSFEVFRNRNN